MGEGVVVVDDPTIIEPDQPVTELLETLAAAEQGELVTETGAPDGTRIPVAVALRRSHHTPDRIADPDLPDRELTADLTAAAVADLALTECAFMWWLIDSEPVGFHIDVRYPPGHNPGHETDDRQGADLTTERARALTRPLPHQD